MNHTRSKADGADRANECQWASHSSDPGTGTEPGAGGTESTMTGLSGRFHRAIPRRQRLCMQPQR
jgi:hypothetical protein